jgi:tetratricopeptide (TPR) repeat protein
MVRAANDRQIWAKTYEGEASDAVRLQGQVTLAVAHEISARITAETRSRLARWDSVSPRAYDSYLRGRYLWNQRGQEAITEAVSFFEQALRDDPKLALAYSGLADCYTIGWGAVLDYELAEGYALEAVALEPDLAEAHVSLALAHCHQWRFAEAERELKRALELDPAYVPAHQVYSIYLLTTGRAIEALAANDRALRLDPFSLPVNNLRGYILVGLRQYDRAIAHLQVAGGIAPLTVAPQEQLARIYWMQGKGSEALAVEREIAKRSNSELLQNGQAQLEAAFAKSGFRAACLASVQLKERAYSARPAGTAFYPMMIPLQYAALQDKEKVLESLAKQLRNKGYGPIMLLKTAPELDFMRDDPKFQELLRPSGHTP